MNMETILPSEIARLVVGYLEDQKCDEAAKIFLETSPHLHECRIIHESGQTFRKLAYEMTLVEILQKYSSIKAIVQERLSKLADSEQLKQCGDFLEQVRFLIDGSRSQRFVVNINVPSQNSAPNTEGSPIISSSVRKRQRSCGDRDRDRERDRDRSKRFAKSFSQTPDKQSRSENRQFHCDRPEATQVESLPGHIDSRKANGEENSAFLKQKNKEVRFSQNECFNGYESRFHVQESSSEQAENKVQKEIHEKLNSEGGNKTQDFSANVEKCSMATNTEELIKNYQDTGTQSWDQIIDFEGLVNNEPLENLSLLGKELLHCKELHEQIAENINKSGLLPIDSAYKEDAANANNSGVHNAGIFKSIVEETMVDPVFQQCFGSVFKITDSNSNDGLDTENNAKSKHELNRDSESQTSKKQNSNPDNEENSQLDNGQIINDLNDHNNAAIQSIINANFANIDPTPKEEKLPNEKKILKESATKNSESKDNDCIDLATNDDLNNSIEIINPLINRTGKPKITDIKILKKVKNHKGTKRKDTKPVKKESAQKDKEKDDKSEEMMMTRTTLVFCSKDDHGSFLGVPYQSANMQNPLFLPIAPKTTEPVYFKSVNVPQRMPSSLKTQPEVLHQQNQIPFQTEVVQNQIPFSITAPLSQVPQPSTIPIISLSEETITTDYRVQNSLPSIAGNIQNFPTEPVQNIIINIDKAEFKDPNVELNSEVPKIPKEPEVENNLEQITLYGNETSSAAFLQTDDIGTLNVDASMSFSLSGLSPFLKMNKVRAKDSPPPENSTNEALSENVPKNITEEKIPENVDILSEKPTEDLTKSVIFKKTDLITKRTPKSIIKSRSKNHRLSLSTPRRRNSHVRALDFGTPPKSSNSASKSSPGSTLNRSKSHCRTSLFKSPPFDNSQKSPSAEVYKIPIATRSPPPTLKGGWEKFTGMDMILGNNNSNSAPVEKTSPAQKKVLKSWDTELRLAINAGQPLLPSEENKKSKAPKRKYRKQKNTPISEKKKKTQKKKLKTPAKKDNSAKKEKNDSPELNVSDAKNTSSFFPNDKSLSFTLEDTKIPETNDTKIVENLVPKSCEKKVEIIEKKSSQTVKKYVKLITVPRSESQTNSEFMKTSPKKHVKLIKIPNMKDLETPRKLENSLGIPPTPRILSPSSSSATPFTKVSSEDSGKIPDFFPTPDFAPTPGNKMTPHLAGDNTKDAITKGELSSCSPYYQPSSEIVDAAEKMKIVAKNVTKVAEFQVIKVNLPREEVAKEDLIISSSSIEISESVAAIDEKEISADKSSLESESETSDSDSDSSSSFSSSSSSSTSSDSSRSSASESQPPSAKKISDVSEKSCSESSDESFQITCEIDEEENIPDGVQNSEKIETVETETNKNSEIVTVGEKKDSQIIFVSEMDLVEQEIEITTTNSIELEKSSEKMPELIKSTNSREKDVETKKKDLEMKIKGLESRRNSQISVTKNVDIKLSKIDFVPVENSPMKMFSVTNTEEKDDQETPAKDDALIEAMISETPSSSKTGTDVPTNLSTKISEIMAAKPKINPSTIEVANILNQAEDRASFSLASSAIDHDKLKAQLDLKRERLKNSLSLCGQSRGRGKARTRGGNAGGLKRVRFSNVKKQSVKNTGNEEEKVSESVEESLNHEKKKIEKNAETAENLLEGKKPVLRPKSTRNIKSSKAAWDKKLFPELMKKDEKTDLEEEKNKSEIAKSKSNKIELSKNKTEPDKNKLETNKSREKDTIVDTKLNEIITKVEDQKCLMKAKVDQVKRDLFSDDEAQDQMTTRSKARRSSETQKSDFSDNVAEQSEKSVKESLPCVLQSLDLVPATKIDNNESCNELQNTSDFQHALFHYVYDETTAVKRRKRKYSFTDIELQIEGETNRVLVGITPYEEIFNFTPKPKKRTTKKSPVKISKKVTDSVENYSKPLAASSPIFKATQASGKSAAVLPKIDDVKKNDNEKIDKGKVAIEKEKQKSKSRKRKNSNTAEENDHTKPKLAVPENYALLENADVEKLLSHIHGQDE